MGLFGNISTINHISPSFKRNGNVPKYMHNVGKRNGIEQIANKKGKSVKFTPVCLNMINENVVS